VSHEDIGSWLGGVVRPDTNEIGSLAFVPGTRQSGLFKRALSISFLPSKSVSLQRPGIEPGTSAVLKPRHNQLDHLC
jgi:hypothetical protein